MTDESSSFGQQFPISGSRRPGVLQGTCQSATQGPPIADQQDHGVSFQMAAGGSAQQAELQRMKTVLQKALLPALTFLPLLKGLC